MTEQTAAERARQRYLDKLLAAQARRMQEEAARKVEEVRQVMEESMRELLGR
jgi:lysyl-tRNA synthetase class II